MAKFPKDYHQEKSENDKKLAVIIKLKKQKIGQVRLLSWVNILSTISLGFDLNLHSYTPVLFSSTRFLSSVIADIQHDLDQVYLTVAAIMDYMIQKCWEPPSTVIPLFAIVLLHLVWNAFRVLLDSIIFVFYIQNVIVLIMSANVCCSRGVSFHLTTNSCTQPLSIRPKGMSIQFLFTNKTRPKTKMIIFQNSYPNLNPSPNNEPKKRIYPLIKSPY